MVGTSGAPPMYKVLALMRVSMLTAMSYRLSMVISLFGLVVSVVPLYFVANALQPVMAESISSQGGQYFAFVLVGMIALSFVPAAMNSVPGAISGGITSGTLETLTSTPTRLPTLLAGLTGYGFCWVAVRSLLLVAAGSLLGAQFEWSRLLFGTGILALIVLAYLPIGLLAASLVLVFRTAGPLSQGVMVLSALLGGVYYPTHVIPSWIETISFAIPLTYGLRALRQTVLEGLPPSAVLVDVGILAGFAAVLLAIGAACFHLAYRCARRAGTLSQY
jgi:ABC-2 type transport system permease protein